MVKIGIRLQARPHFLAENVNSVKSESEYLHLDYIKKKI